MGDDGGHIEDVGVGDEEGGGFAGFDRAELSFEAQDFCGVDGDASQGGFVVEPMGDGDGGGFGEVAFVGVSA